MKLIFNMSKLILLILISFSYENIFSEDNWSVPEASSVVCLNDEKELVLYIISANQSQLMVRKKDAHGGDEHYEYNLEDKFENMNIYAAMGGFLSDLVFIFYDKYLQVFNDRNQFSKKYEIPRGYFRNTLKKLNQSLIYISNEFKIVKIDIGFKNSEYQFNIQNNIFINSDEEINSISCDISKDYNYFICSYYINNNFEISLFSGKLSLLERKKFDSKISDSKNIFNKILFLSEDEKIISISSKSDTEIRLRYLKNNGGKIDIIKLQKEKNIEVEYLDLDGTQLDKSYLYNDMINLNNDEIFKVYMKNDIFILSKIQFYDNDKVMTLKTKKYTQQNYEANTVHIINRNNGMVIDFQNKNTFEIIEIGHIKTTPLSFIDETSFQINNYEIESFLKTKQIAEVESIPKDFTFMKILENTFLAKYSKIDTENDIFQILQYKLSQEAATLNLQTKLIYEFPQDSDIQIFPPGTPPIETKIISLGNKADISFKMTICENQNGFYKIKDTDICTKIRPVGYYLSLEKNIFLKCHVGCDDCIDYSDNSNDMKCLSCRSGYIYDDTTFNCYALQEIVPKTLNIEIRNNTFFWVFLVIMIIGIIFAFLIICQDNICKRTNSAIIENDNKDSLENEENEELKDK